VESSHRCALAVIETRARQQSAGDCDLEVVRRRFPSLPLLAFCIATTTSLRDAFVLGRGGCSDILIVGCEDVASRLRDLLRSAQAQSRAADIMRVVPQGAPALLHLIMSRALQLTWPWHTVRSLARAIGLHRKTLATHLASLGFPPPSTVICWCRVLVVAHMLSTTRRSVTDVAYQLDYSSGSALRNMLKRYAQLRPTDVRRPGGFELVARKFRDAISPPEPTTRSWEGISSEIARSKSVTPSH